MPFMALKMTRPGGGIMGSSTAYHLALNGERDVLVLERSRLQSGTTWHAAGLVNALRPSANFTRLIRYSIDLYSRLEAEIGQRRHVLPCRGVRRDPRQQTEGHRSNRVRWIRIQSLAGASEEAGRHRRAVVCESRRRSQGLASVVPFRALRASPSPAPKTTRALQRIPEANLEWALRSYGPARRSSMQLVSRHAETGVDMRPHLPTSPANFETAILKDTEW